MTKSSKDIKSKSIHQEDRIGGNDQRKHVFRYFVWELGLFPTNVQSFPICVNGKY